jgi:thiol:disulfide interchange protein DsbD
MGLLFFILGATSLRLPRSGAWMETVKSVLGVALIAAAVTMVMPWLPKPHELPVSPRNVAIMAGILAFLAVAGGALSHSFHGEAREKALKAVTLVLLLAGVGLQFGWIARPRSDALINWLRDEQMAVNQARTSGKPLLVDFGAEWCAACKELDLHTWTDPVVAQEVSDKFVPLKIDATEESEANDLLMKKYGVVGLPQVLMVNCKDKPKPSEQLACAVPGDGPARVTGFLTPPEMLQRLRTVE